MRYREYWITDHTDNSGFTVDTKEDLKSVGACNYIHVIDAIHLHEAQARIELLEKVVKRQDEVISFYGDPNNWLYPSKTCRLSNRVELSCGGDIARKVKQECEEMMKEKT